MTRTPEDKLLEALREAHAHEVALISNLTAHIGIASPGDYKSRLEIHLKETRQHEDLVRRRLGELGYTKNMIQFGLGLARTVFEQSLVLAKGPIDMIRGMDANEKMVKNIRDEMVTEIVEIGTYDYIERLARNFGDLETAELAAEIRREEEAMLDDLRGFLPELTDRVVRTQIATMPTLVNAEPWAGYDQQTADEITKELAGAPEGLRVRVRQYERHHKDRATVIEATERSSATS